MSSSTFLNHLNQTFSKEGKTLLFEFFIAFSRFEYALKSNGFFHPNASPDWDRFVNSINSSFNQSSSTELNTAVNFIISYPPRIQSVNTGNISWENRNIDANAPLINKLRLHISDIRNNLFHGGKFNGSMERDISRNYILIQSAVTVLNNWLTLNSQLDSSFNESIAN